MEYLHSRNIVHGDLNPSNVMCKAMRAAAPKEGGDASTSPQQIAVFKIIGRWGGAAGPALSAQGECHICIRGLSSVVGFGVCGRPCLPACLPACPPACLLSPPAQLALLVCCMQTLACVRPWTPGSPT